jgi:hypothetical protein
MVDRRRARATAAVVIVAAVVIGGVVSVVATRSHGHQQATGQPGGPSASPTSSASGAPVRSDSSYWMIEDDAIGTLQHSGLSAAAVHYFFDTGTGLVITRGVTGRQADTSVDRVVPASSEVESFGSYLALKQAFSTGAISSGTRYILFDDEHWAATPTDEQQDPIGYEQKVATLVHAHHLRLIFTPAANLSTVLTGRGTDKFASYLKLGLATQGATYADVFEIQAQQAEGTAGFTSFVTSAAAQARAANPDCIVLVGIGSNPAGRSVSAQTILADYASVRAAVNGFWFNIPGPNPQPQVAVDFFTTLLAQAQS